MIDVFICTYNPNSEFLRRTVDAVLSQNLDKTEWNFTIIDNNSTKPVSEIYFIKQLNIKVVVEEEPGLTAARKCAQSISNAEILIFVDDDNVLDSDYLFNAKQLMQDEHIGILSGNILPLYETKPKRWFKQFEPMLAIRYFGGTSLIINKDYYFNMLFPIGAGMVIRKELIANYYNNHISQDNYIDGRKGDELTSSEDVDLDLYALSEGFKIGISPKLRLGHIIPFRRTEVDYIINLAKGNLKSQALVNKKWKPVFKEDIFNIVDSSIFKLKMAVQIYKAMSFMPWCYIKYAIFKEKLKYKKINNKIDNGY